MSKVRGERRPGGTADRWSELLGRRHSGTASGRTDGDVNGDGTPGVPPEADRGVAGDGGTDSDDVRDDERTRSTESAARAGATTPAGSPDGDGAEPAGQGSAAPVEELLVRLAAAERALTEAETARAEAVRRAEALAAELERARATPPETFGMRADKVLRMAQHEAAQRLRDAEAEAAALRENAGAEAARITDDAYTEAIRITSDARAEVDAAMAAGATARRDSELVADTAASMHAHVNGLRSSVRAELARVHALLGAEIGRLDAPPLPGTGAVRGPDPQAARPGSSDTGPVPAVTGSGSMVAGSVPTVAGSVPTVAGSVPTVAGSVPPRPRPAPAHALRDPAAATPGSGPAAGADTGELPVFSAPVVSQPPVSQPAITQPAVPQPPVTVPVVSLPAQRGSGSGPAPADAPEARAGAPAGGSDPAGGFGSDAAGGTAVDPDQEGDRVSAGAVAADEPGAAGADVRGPDPEA
ncbi:MULTISPECIES: hypothetical protein [Pseudonocardia]|uniref:Uncharacterized protein n=2 Tax=Pseudonocardia TaxID=1847 RepID=A0A1Y2MMS0_PSEAH|nr:MULTISPECIES: hypothetical protein [Pseudonocardia]OSY36554.1 hypothetical protein BG845_05321 [Pseudonocardia autotrophica]TDN76265.1 hypothetical protein C8E95_5459 [Pseudonocardia autotrophica]BBG00249.1 hypothetical protein Pdca_14580 [Pseudonocardia autotrophica]GEC28742.1 hypothetical protein PSA01_57710 [Pseudonocardia saturnea]